MRPRSHHEGADSFLQCVLQTVDGEALVIYRHRYWPVPCRLCGLKGREKAWLLKSDGVADGEGVSQEALDGVRRPGRHGEFSLSNIGGEDVVGPFGQVRINEIGRASGRERGRLT